MELRPWLEQRMFLIASRWHAEIQLREDRRGDGSDGTLESFLRHMVSFLPECLGEKREMAEEVWQQAAHLYGSFGLRRGLAAGEVAEELHLLRSVINGVLMQDPPEGSEERPILTREVLGLYRLLDRGVVGATVAYVDDLFFAHLQGSGVSEGVTAVVEEEIARQLRAFREELRSEDPAQWRDHDES